jgi:hypothetical protein
MASMVKSIFRMNESVRIELSFSIISFIEIKRLDMSDKLFTVAT